MECGMELHQLVTVSFAYSIGFSKAIKDINMSNIIIIVVVNCGSPPDITNGTFDINRGTTFGSVAVYSCDVGFNLNGGAIISCQANGTWSGPIPTCNSEN